eukprot:PhF_6_TR10806/c0_g1_i3/m.17403
MSPYNLYGHRAQYATTSGAVTTPHVDPSQLKIFNPRQQQQQQIPTTSGGNKFVQPVPFNVHTSVPGPNSGRSLSPKKSSPLRKSGGSGGGSSGKRVTVQVNAGSPTSSSSSSYLRKKKYNDDSTNTSSKNSHREAPLMSSLKHTTNNNFQQQDTDLQEDTAALSPHRRIRTPTVPTHTPQTEIYEFLKHGSIDNDTHPIQQQRNSTTTKSQQQPARDSLEDGKLRAFTEQVTKELKAFQKLEGWVAEGSLGCPIGMDDDVLLHHNNNNADESSNDTLPLRMQLALSRERNRHLETQVSYLKKELKRRDQKKEEETLTLEQLSRGEGSGALEGALMELSRVQARLQAAQNLLAEREKEILSLRKKCLTMMKS